MNGVPKTLRDVGCFETRMTLFQSSVNAALSNCVKKDLLEERVGQLNECISRLERKLDAETKALAARCEGLERMLAHFRETPKQGETSGKEVQKEEQKRNDSRLSRAFKKKDLEVMVRGVEALKEWTGMKNETIIYDSTKDPFTAEGLFQMVKGKSNVAIIATTTAGDVFGGFYRVAVTNLDRGFMDPNIFIFSFESHGRCMTPRRFVLREKVRAKACVRFNNDRDGFVWFGSYAASSGFTLGNQASNSFCADISRAFEGLVDTTLTGKNWEKANFGPYHHCTRLVAIQLE